jgi:hypothetical protein
MAVPDKSINLLDAAGSFATVSPSPAGGAGQTEQEEFSEVVSKVLEICQDCEEVRRLGHGGTKIF